MPVPKSSAPIRSNRTPLAEIAYQHLLQQIASGQLAAGTAIDDRSVAEDLDMSPATVRLAVGRLVEIGLIDMAPNRYTRVAEPSPTRFIQTVTVAVALWRLAARLFMFERTPELAERFHARVLLVIDGIDSITDGNLFIGQVLDVFDFFVAYSGNSVLVDTAARVRPVIAHTARLGETAYDLPGTLALMTALDDAVAAGDANAVDAALSRIDELADSFLTRHTTGPSTF